MAAGRMSAQVRRSPARKCGSFSEKFLEHTSKIDLVDDKHGPRSNRNFNYEASFIIRGLSELHLKLTSAAGDVAIDSPGRRTEGPGPAPWHRCSWRRA